MEPTSTESELETKRKREERAEDVDESQDNLCWVCKVEKFKYKCPGCPMKTCSVTCVKQHKADTGCTGKRPRTDYVSLKEFGERELRSDLRFLEDVNRMSDNAKRGSRGVQAGNRGPRRLGGKQQELLKQAASRKTTVVFMPNGMSRRKENGSVFERRSGKIFWRIEWRQVHSPTRVMVLEKGDETETIETLYKKTFEKADRQGWPCHDAAFFELRGVSIPGRESSATTSAAADRGLRGCCSLKQALAQSTLLEFPTIWVTPRAVDEKQ